MCVCVVCEESIFFCAHFSLSDFGFCLGGEVIPHTHLLLHPFSFSPFPKICGFSPPIPFSNAILSIWPKKKKKKEREKKNRLFVNDVLSVYSPFALTLLSPVGGRAKKSVVVV